MKSVPPSWNCPFSSSKTPYTSSTSLIFEVKYTYFGSHHSKLSWTAWANWCGPYWNLNMNYVLPFINECLVFNWWNYSRNFRKWPGKRNHDTGDIDFKVLSWPSVTYSQPLFFLPTERRQSSPAIFPSPQDRTSSWAQHRLSRGLGDEIPETMREAVLPLMGSLGCHGHREENANTALQRASIENLKLCGQPRRHPACLPAIEYLH